MTRKIQKFEAQWGIRCNDIAEMEETTPEAIRMRVKRFGSPWQRRGKLTKFEEKYGKTLGQLALDIGVHPHTIARREKEYGDVFVESRFGNGVRGKILNKRGDHWTENEHLATFRIKPTYMDQHNENKET